MYSAALYPLFFILVGISVVAAHVEPPANVTFHCGNRKNILEWEYTNLMAQGLRFRVDILSYQRLKGVPSEIWVDSPSLQADLSFLPPLDQEYLLSVTAKIGEEESTSSPEGGITFSYFQHSLADKKCPLDFPSITVIAQPNDELQLSFEHPWQIYVDENDHDENMPLPPFKYNVKIVNQSGDHTFMCEEKECVETVAVKHAQEEYCVDVSGEVEKIAVKGKEEYCVPYRIKKASYDYIYIFIGLLAVIVSALLTYMVYHKVTNPHTALPSSMTFNGPLSSTFSPQVNQVTVEQGTILEVEPNSPTPLLTAISEENSSTTHFSDYDERKRFGLPSEDEGVSDVEVQQQRECPDYMHGNDFEDDDGLASTTGYERREVLVTLDPNEQTQGYRG
ncbi:interferon gamma receptor 1-like [Parambassis ranga]|uniref:Interferon gamma receptor 1-like n=1 Tax=Parambassis ranga TaxID=210632 RepID=A0A6P7JNM0_9TELE|nr:interferon gamma receptor 1-like [Parambassis ranga]XP_028280069.1 interferon gamma receptor 1-like [Parambassis ranga]